MSRTSIMIAILGHKQNKFHVDFLNAQSYSQLVCILEVLNGTSKGMPELD